MRVLAEAAVFLGLAAAVHLALGLGMQGQGGAEGAGDGGAAPMTLEAAPERFAALAEAWRAAPEVETGPPRPLEAPAVAMPGAEMPGEARESDSAGTISAVTPELPGMAASEHPLPAPGPQVPGDVALLAPLHSPGETTASAMPSAEAPAKGSRPVAPAPPALAQDTLQSPAPPAATEPPPPLVVARVAGETDRRPRPRPEPEAAPAAPPAQASAPRPAQRAEGAGGGGVAGRQADAPAATLSESARRSLMGEWGGAIRARIDRQKQFPSGLRQSRAAGTVLLRLEVGRDGGLLGAGVARSSGHSALDRAALEAVRRAGRFPAAPGALREASFRFDLPVSFQP